MARILYNLLFPVLTLPAIPFWLWKTRKRGGLSSRLWEKLALYDAASPVVPEAGSGPIYLHAASVGEVNIARKLITEWHRIHPETHFLLAVGTSTGFDLARSGPPPQTEALYAPLDFPPCIAAFLTRYRPRLIVLIEHEVWPNLMHQAQRAAIPVALANARLSPRSGRRLAKARFLLGSTYAKLSWVGAQSASDLPRLAAIGIRAETLHEVGSLKFDPALATPSASALDPAPLLAALSEGGQGPVLMALSTHSGEELIFARAAALIEGARIVIIPRHMERRGEIVRELTAAGFETALRSTLDPSEPGAAFGKILLVDTTGEMPAFTALADVAFIGKSLTAEGGQNPCEAIAARVPVIAGPHLENFEPLARELRHAKGLTTVADEGELSLALRELLDDRSRVSAQTTAALKTLEIHRLATRRTVEALSSLS